MQLQPDEEPETIVDNEDDFDYESVGEDERYWIVLSVLIKMKARLILSKTFASNYSWVWAMSTNNIE